MVALIFYWWKYPVTAAAFGCSGSVEMHLQWCAVLFCTIQLSLPAVFCFFFQKAGRLSDQTDFWETCLRSLTRMSVMKGDFLCLPHLLQSRTLFFTGLLLVANEKQLPLVLKCVVVHCCQKFSYKYLVTIQWKTHVYGLSCYLSFSCYGGESYTPTITPCSLFAARGVERNHREDKGDGTEQWSLLWYSNCEFWSW